MLASKIATQSTGKAEYRSVFFFLSDTHTHTQSLLCSHTHTNKHTHIHAHTQQQTAATSASLAAHPHPSLLLSQSFSLGALSSFSCLLCLQRLNLPSCPPSAVCHRGDIASAAMATSQQDSGFFDISIKSLLKSLGGSEYR